MYALYASCEGYRVCLNGHEKGHYDHKLQVHQWNHRNFETTAFVNEAKPFHDLIV